MSYKINNAKSAFHAFMLAVGTTVAEPATILPLLVHHFSSSLVLVGVFASLLRGGAIAVQLFAAFYAQGYERVMPYMHRVFFFRFASWFAVGASIFLVGDRNPSLTLWLIGIFFFTFSFSAGFGAIYFKEILAKIFDSRERGRAVANRQFFSALGAILSGGVAGWVLEHYPAPDNYAYLFMISSFIVLAGLVAFGSIHEPPKHNTRQREESFRAFLRNARAILREDRRLQLQVIVSLLGYSFLLAMPFVIIKAKQTIELTGWLIGGFITIQMIGAMIGNLFLWKRFAPDYARMLEVAYGFMIAAFVLALVAQSALSYAVIFFVFGIGMDGFRNADSNLVLEIAPEDKRPVYVAIQSTLVSLGLFFSIPGGFILEWFGYRTLYIVTLLMLFIGLTYTHKLKHHIDND
jgi:MFS family permease